MSNRWSPYVDNGGTAVAIAGRDYATIVADTRCARGYSVLSRNASKVVKLTDKVCLVTCGMRADSDALHKKMKMIVDQYQFEHNEAPSVEALAQRLSVELYSHRFFPYYAINLLVGVSAMEGGRGKVFTYDSIGNTEAKVYGATGAAGSMILSVIDIGLKKGRRVGVSGEPAADAMDERAPDLTLLSAEDAVKLGVDALTAATERNIETGDSAEAWIIHASGEVERQVFQLRQD